MIEYVFGLADLGRLRFAISPSWELAASLQALLKPAEAALHVEWVREVRGSLDDLDLRPAFALLSHSSYIPDFFTPPPESPLTTIADDFQRMLATSSAQIRKEVGVVAEEGLAPELQAFIAQPRRELRRLVRTLEEYWRRALAPSWPRIDALLQADLAARGRELAERGPVAALDRLHPNARWRDDRLRVDVTLDRTCELGGRGLQLVPSAFHWTRPRAIIGAPWQPTVIYPARGVGLLWQPDLPATDALARILGRTRARILTALAAPASTTQLATRLGITPGGASQHLTALAAAGLVAGQRHGREVLYLRTPRGDALLPR
jgi:DNA-binding transcriptional ArsR family regulator